VTIYELGGDGEVVVRNLSEEEVMGYMAVRNVVVEDV